jgi:hypothetical protein
MKNIWKWVIGIVIVMVIIASVVCASVFVRNHMAGIRNDVGAFRSYGFNPHMQPGGQGFRFEDHGGMMQGYGYFHPMFGFGSIFFRGLIPLLLLGLLAYGIYRLGFHNAQKSENKLMMNSEVVEDEAVNTTTSIEELKCSKCGEVVEEGWRNCPHCGKRL